VLTITWKFIVTGIKYPRRLLKKVHFLKMVMCTNFKEKIVHSNLVHYALSQVNMQLLAYINRFRIVCIIRHRSLDKFIRISLQQSI